MEDSFKDSSQSLLVEGNMMTEMRNQIKSRIKNKRKNFLMRKRKVDILYKIVKNVLLILILKSLITAMKYTNTYQYE